jgi:type II secretion system protein N
VNAQLQALVDRARAIELTPQQRRLLLWAGYPLFALLVALLTFYWSVPRDRVKDRLEAALSADVTTAQPLAIGMDVSIGELKLTLFTGAGFNATDVVLRTRPINPGDKPARYIVDDVRLRVGLLSTLFGHPNYSFKAHALSGTVSGHIATGDDTKLSIEADKLVLNGVPAIAAAAGGLPIEGVVSGKFDVLAPKNLVANASGKIDVTIDDAGVGDGKAKLTVPTNDPTIAPFLGAGVTVPKIRLGKLTGQIIIDNGHARFENVRVHSADADAMLEGHAELHDPIAMSQLHAYLKVRLAEALVKREPTLELLNNVLGGAAKRADGYIGLQITGLLSGPFCLPSKDPPFGVATRDEPAPRPTTTAAPAPAAPAFVPPPNMPAQPPPPSPPPPAEPSPPTAAPQPAATPPPPSVPPSGAAVEGGRGAGEAGREAPPPPPGAVGPPPMRTVRPEAFEAPPGRE